jgi:molybdopterin/thiamine biosynthesis adenylyltransferase
MNDTSKNRKFLEELNLLAIEIFDGKSNLKIKVLHEEKAIQLALKYQYTLRSVYVEAMKSGVCPYRYIRNRESISMQDQIRLAESRIAVVGSGGLGGHVILLLARIGIGHLRIIDGDVFDETNLNRQPLSSTETINKAKPKIAEDVVKLINPSVDVSIITDKVNAENADNILSGANVIVDALDNMDDRLMVEKVAKKNRIPFVHGAVAGFTGQVTTVFPEDKGLTFLYGENGCQVNDKDSPEAILGVPVLAPALIASMQAMEVVKILLNRSGVFRNTLVNIDLENGQLDKYEF